MSPSTTKALVELLKSLFTTDELYRFATFLPHGNLASALPGAPASLDAVAFEMVQVLKRHGWIDDEFFTRLEDERLGRKAEIARIRTLILDSKPKQSDIIDFTGERGRHEHFFGRHDILREFDEWLRVRDSGWLLLTGSPGLGKSALFNHWLGLREQAGLPVAFHFIRRGIHNWADPSVVRASLAAQIERDFPDQRDADADPAQRLEQLLHRISPVLEQRRQQLVLLVDGLDEAMTLGGAGNPIPRIFPHELPKRVFVFAASRPLYPHLDWFKRRTGALNPVDLDGRSGKLETVRAFWTALRGALSPPPADDLVRAAVERSEGNLLHAVKLHQLWSQPGAERSIDAIPHGFEGMLRELWERLGNLTDEQWEIARQGLSLLCAARQALPLSVIDELLEWSEGKARHKLLPLLRELLHEEHWHEQPAYRPFHEGVRELVERELPGTLREHHRRLARFAAWPATGSGFRRDYAVRHRVVHQVEAGEIEEAAASCRDVDYLTEKACALGVVEIEREIRLAARVQEPTARKHLGTLALAVGACSHWARKAPAALPALLHDRLLSYAPAVRGELAWPTDFRQSGPLLRHPLQTGGLARILAGHQDRVVAIAVLPDGRLVSGSYDGTLHVWDVASGQDLAILTWHIGAVTAVAVLPDGRVIAGYSDGHLLVWNVEDGQAVGIEPDYRGKVRALRVFRDGLVLCENEHTLDVWDVASTRHLATLRGSVSGTAVSADGRVVFSSYDGCWRLWDVASGWILATLRNESHAAVTVAVLPNGRVVSGSNERTLQVWDVESGQAVATIEGHRGDVSAVAVLPDGHVVSGARDGTLRIWDVERRQVVATLESHLNAATAIVVLPDGRVIFGSDGGTLRVWDVESGQVLTLNGYGRRVTAMAVLPDGRVVSGSEDGLLRIWNVASGKAVATLAGHLSSIEAVAVLPDGRVVSGSQDRTLRIWDIESRQELTRLAGHQGEVHAVGILPDGRIVSASADYTLRVWDASSGQELDTLAGHSFSVLAVAVLPDGRIVSASADCTLRIWDIASRQALDTFAGRATEICAVLPDGRVVSHSGDSLHLWDLEHGQALVTLRGHHRQVTDVAALPDGRVVSGSHDRTLKVWDVESGQALATLAGHQDSVMAVAVLPDGRIVSGSDDKTLRVWDVESGQALSTPGGHQDLVRGVAVLPDGCVVSGSKDRTLRVWDVENGQVLATFVGHQGSVQAVTVLPNGRVISASGDKVLRVWDVESGQTVSILRGHQRMVSALAVFPDGRVVSGSYDRTMRVWSVESGEALATLGNYEGVVTAVAVLPDGRVVSGSEDGLLRIWNVANGQAVATLAGHVSSIEAVAVLPDGRVVSGSQDRTLRVWDVESGQALAPFLGHQGVVQAVAVLPDGRVVSGSQDRTLRVWDVESGQALATVYGDASFWSVAVVSQHFLVAGDGAGNVWFMDLP